MILNFQANVRTIPEISSIFGFTDKLLQILFKWHLNFPAVVLRHLVAKVHFHFRCCCWT